MQNIKNFEEFTNEGKFWDALQKINRFFKGVNKKLQDSLGNFTKKLETSKDWNNTLSIFNSNILQPYSTYFEDSMKNATTIDQIRKLNYEIQVSTFPALNEMKLKYGLKPNSVFDDPNLSAMYNFDTTDAFVKNLPNAVNALVKNFATKAKYPMDEVDKSINNYKDLTADPPKTNTPETPAKPEAKPAETPAPANQQQSNNAIRGNSTEKHIMSYDDYNKIFEADPAAPAEPTATATTSNQPIDTLKQENINVIKNNFYGVMQKKLKAFKPTVSGTTETNSVEDKNTQNVVSKMTASGKNTKGKETLLKTIFNDKTTPDQLNKTRDAIAPIFKIDKPEETIGKF